MKRREYDVVQEIFAAAKRRKPSEILPPPVFKLTSLKLDEAKVFRVMFVEPDVIYVIAYNDPAYVLRRILLTTSLNQKLRKLAAAHKFIGISRFIGSTLHLVATANRLGDPVITFHFVVPAAAKPSRWYRFKNMLRRVFIRGCDDHS